MTTQATRLFRAVPLSACPKCALDFYLGAQLIAMGIFVSPLCDARLVVMAFHLTFVSISCMKWIWAAVFLMAGFFQIFSLSTNNVRTRRLAAFGSFLVMLQFCIVQARGGVPILAGVAGLAALYQGYVFAMLRGHQRWRRS